jgi:hypothetical protein
VALGACFAAVVVRQHGVSVLLVWMGTWRPRCVRAGQDGVHCGYKSVFIIILFRLARLGRNFFSLPVALQLID